MTGVFGSQTSLSSKQTQRVISTLVLLASVLLIGGCGPSSSDFEKSQVEIAAIKSELDEVKEGQQNADGIQKGLSLNIDSLQAGLAKLDNRIDQNENDVNTANSGLSNLKNSFSLTREDVNSNKTTVDNVETNLNSALALARLALISELYFILKTHSSVNESRATHLAIGTVVNNANDPNLVQRWNPLATTLTLFYDDQFASAEAFARAFIPQEDAFLAYIRTAQSRALTDWEKENNNSD